jgi:hypothetical protein
MTKIPTHSHLVFLFVDDGGYVSGWHTPNAITSDLRDDAFGKSVS